MINSRLAVLALAGLAATISWAQSGNRDRKSTRLNSSHLVISYAVFCLKKKNANLPALIAAEATITLTRMHRHENPRLAMRISNNDLSLLHFLKSTAGSATITNTKTYSK